MPIRIGLFHIAPRWRGLALGLMLPACTTTNQETCTVFTSDFEQFQGWVSPLPAFLTTDLVHSGRYAYRMSRESEFGPGYATTLSACSFVPRELQLSGWAYLPSGRISNALVVAINCHGRRPDVWEGFNLDEVVTRYQVWVPVRWHISLPDDLDPTDELKFYVWHQRGDADVATLDDLTLEGWR